MATANTNNQKTILAALVTVFGKPMVDSITNTLDGITPESDRLTAGDVIDSYVTEANQGVADDDKVNASHVRCCFDKVLDTYPKLYVRRGPGGGIVHVDEPRNTPAGKGGKGVSAALAALEAAGIELTPAVIELAVNAAKQSRKREE